MKKFSVATFNLLNLNEPGLPMYKDTKGWSQEQYDRKIAWTARQIDLLNADVMAFQELWHAESLGKAFDLSSMAGGYQLLVPPNATGKKIICAAAVRQEIPVESLEWIEEFPEGFVLDSGGGDAQTPAISVEIKGFSRPVLHALLRLHPDEPLVHLYVCHFKSKAPTDLFREPWYDKEVHGMHHPALGAAVSTIRRTAEAAAMRVILNLVMKDTDQPVIVMGDINDGQNSNTQNILTGQPGYLFGDAMGGGDTVLYSAQIMQEFRDTRDVLYTYSHKGMKESLDHILFSQEFYDQSKKRRWLFDGLVVNNDHLNQDDHKESGTNDHGLIKASFIYRPVLKSG
ncbi:MAG: endonuclease/exonuclease/phosphatase family protein [Gammaproteobacteria bacterium]|nr:endonuclease/exonuclease/phosphatase family protein [Gammaproteobacteria bacterium]MBU1969404.1 endonuclease/exonuclease/phosphatase family protein [Gammaproteobacteria bacterium]